MPTLFCDFREIWMEASNPSSDLATCIMLNMHMLNDMLDSTLTEGDARYFIKILNSVSKYLGYAKSNNPSTTQADCILALQKIDLCSKLLAGYYGNTIDEMGTHTRNKGAVIEEMQANISLIDKLKLLIVTALDPCPDSCLDPSYICLFVKQPEQPISVSLNDDYFNNLFTKLDQHKASVILGFLPLKINQVDNIAEKYDVDLAAASHALLSAVDIAITETIRQVNLLAPSETGFTSPDSIAYEAEEIKHDFLSKLLSGLEYSKTTLIENEELLSGAAGSTEEQPSHKRQRPT